MKKVIDTEILKIAEKKFVTFSFIKSLYITNINFFTPLNLDMVVLKL